jgi:hypothetical protein
MWKGWEKGWNRGALIFYYPGLHTELTADAGIYILINLTLFLYPSTVDRPLSEGY